MLYPPTVTSLPIFGHPQYPYYPPQHVSPPARDRTPPPGAERRSRNTECRSWRHNLTGSNVSSTASTTNSNNRSNTTAATNLARTTLKKPKPTKRPPTPKPPATRKEEKVTLSEILLAAFAGLGQFHTTFPMPTTPGATGITYNPSMVYSPSARVQDNNRYQPQTRNTSSSSSAPFWPQTDQQQTISTPEPAPAMRTRFTETVVPERDNAVERHQVTAASRDAKTGPKGIRTTARRVGSWLAGLCDRKKGKQSQVQKTVPDMSERNDEEAFSIERSRLVSVSEVTLVEPDATVFEYGSATERGHREGVQVAIWGGGIWSWGVEAIFLYFFFSPGGCGGDVLGRSLFGLWGFGGLWGVEGGKGMGLGLSIWIGMDWDWGLEWLCSRWRKEEILQCLPVLKHFSWEKKSHTSGRGGMITGKEGAGGFGVLVYPEISMEEARWNVSFGGLGGEKGFYWGD
ncbi:hypothetical protein BDZ91DRAFT_763323 [Kalaharituber pfeilii]|nr:hypothetical protein BDZ91DRAFT_763323 [Kalaharituber pfeilii]